MKDHRDFLNAGWCTAFVQMLSLMLLLIAIAVCFLALFVPGIVGK